MRRFSAVGDSTRDGEVEEAPLETGSTQYTYLSIQKHKRLTRDLCALRGGGERTKSSISRPSEQSVSMNDHNASSIRTVYGAGAWRTGVVDVAEKVHEGWISGFIFNDNAVLDMIWACDIYHHDNAQVEAMKADQARGGLEGACLLLREI